MKQIQLNVFAVFALLMFLGSHAKGAQPTLSIQSGVKLSWSTATGATYRVQWSPGSAGAGPWTDLGAPVIGDATTHSIYDPVKPGTRRYQVLEIVPGSASGPSIPVNGGFELGNGTVASNWTTAANQPPVRTNSAAHTGSFSMRSALTNLTAASSEGNLSQTVPAQSGAVVGGRTYEFSFWARQVSSAPSYVQQYQVQWRNAANASVGGTGLVNFNGTIGEWKKVTVPGLVAPADAVGVRIFFRFVTGAI